MTLTFTLPRTARDAWHYALLLLPFIPLLADEPSGDSATRSVAAVGLLLLGGALLFALNHLFARGPFAARAEVGLLREPWLASLLIVQLPLLADATVALMFFAVTCAILSAMPFGAEFQYDTMTSLLARPSRRAVVWRGKMFVLACFLVAHSAAFALSWIAAGHAFEARAILLIAGMALVAWMTTPFWTLATRSLIASPAFALAVLPIGAMGLIILDAVAKTLGTRFEAIEALRSALGGVVAIGALAVYSVTAAVAGYSLWERLETMPSSARGPGGVYFARRSGRGEGNRSGGLVAKELQLQTVAIAAAVLTVALAIGCAFIPTTQTGFAQLIGATWLMAAGAVALASSTAFADERRLGTLSPQLLQPCSVTLQWFVKVAVAFLISAGAVLAAWIVLVAPTWNNFDLSEQTPLAMVMLFFLCGLFASSVAGSAMRALLGGILLTAVVLGAGSFIVRGAMEWATDSDAARAIASISPSEWRARAAALGPEETMALLSSPPDGVSPRILLSIVVGSAVGVGALTLWFTRRNFARVEAREIRAVAQFGVIFAVFAAALLLVATLMRSDRMALLEDGNLKAAARDLQWEATLGPVERLLRSTYDPNAALGAQTAWLPVLATVPMRAQSGQATVSEGEPVRTERTWKEFLLPLNEDDRAYLLKHGDLPEDMRDALLQESPSPERHSISGPPEPAGVQPPPDISPELKRRHGLSPSL